jgi:hypothetical protein
MKYVAVGVTHATTREESQVIVAIDGFGVMSMNESLARKLADDILRNANFLWPLEESDDGDNQRDIGGGVQG